MIILLLDLLVDDYRIYFFDKINYNKKLILINSVNIFLTQKNQKLKNA